MIVVDSGDQFWRIVSPHRFDEMQGDKRDVVALSRALVFAPRGEVRRVENLLSIARRRLIARFSILGANRFLVARSTGS